MKRIFEVVGPGFEHSNPADLAVSVSDLMQDRGGIVKLPEHEFMPGRYDQRIVTAFTNIASKLQEITQSTAFNFPNTQLHVEPIPLCIANPHIEQDKVRFVVVWGSRTELPLPRPAMIPRYFGPRDRERAREDRQPWEVPVLDGHGFFGVVKADRAYVKLHIISGYPDLDALVRLRHRTKGMHVVGEPPKPGSNCMVSYQLRAGQLPRASLSHLNEYCLSMNPLRFHAGIRWHPVNDSISNFYEPDDEQYALGLLLDKIAGEG